MPITTSAITAGANSDIVLTPNDGTIVTGQAYTSGDGQTVTVTSTAHTLTVGQVILVTAATATDYNGTFRVATVLTNSFTYVIFPGVTAGSGTLSYTKKGLVKNPANESVAGNLYIDGVMEVNGSTKFSQSVLAAGAVTASGATTVSGAFTSSGTANFTGALQVNGTVGYVLTEIFEETIPYTYTTAGTFANFWTSSSFTKPAGEIWVFELSLQHAGYRGYVYEWGIRYGSQTPWTGAYLFVERFHDGNGGGAYTVNTFGGRWVVPAATTLTDNLKMEVVTGNAFAIGATNLPSSSFPSGTVAASTVRIYKYKTA